MRGMDPLFQPDMVHREEGRAFAHALSDRGDHSKPGAGLCWLLASSAGEMDVLIASLLLFFDNQYAKWSENFPR